MPHSVIYLLLLLLAFFMLFVLFLVTHKQSPAEAVSSIEQDVVKDATTAETVVVGDAHKLEADVVSTLHKAEADGTLVAGTVQKFVDAHTGQVQAATLVAQSDASKAVTAA